MGFIAVLDGRAGRPFFTSPTADQLRDWLRRSELELFQVATVDERIVGFVAVTNTSVRVYRRR